MKNPSFKPIGGRWGGGGTAIQPFCAQRGRGRVQLESWTGFKALGGGEGGVSSFACRHMADAALRRRREPGRGEARALVVGNAAYRVADKLANPVNDARGVTRCAEQSRSGSTARPSALIRSAAAS
jgi:hypothetical protein